MKIFLNHFILSIPRLYIKQFPYAWIVFVTFWTWPPNLSWIFLLIVLLGFVMVEWHHAAWLATLRSEYAPSGEKFVVDIPAVPLKKMMRNIPVLLIVAGIVAFFLNQRVGLTTWQVFIIITGFGLLYRNFTFFGARTTYVLTNRGLGIYFAPGHLDYRLFLKFSEIDHAERCGYKKDKGWDCFARTPAEDGFLFLPKNPKGFTKRMEKLFISPRNLDGFQEQLRQLNFL